MPKRKRRILYISLILLLLIPAVDIIVPFVGQYRQTVKNLKDYVNEHGTLPPNESAFGDWDADQYREHFTTPFNIAYGTCAKDLEIREDCIVYQSTGERCKLISGGKNLFYDVFFGWRYNSVSLELFNIMQSPNTEETSLETVP